MNSTSAPPNRSYVSSASTTLSKRVWPTYDPALKDRIDGLKALRDQAKVDAERAQAMLDSTGPKAVTPQMVRAFAKTARQRIRLEGGGYRRDHLRALAQRVEVAEGEVRIIGSKTRLLQTLMAKPGVNAVPTQGLNWRSGSPLIGPIRRDQEGSFYRYPSIS